MSDKEIMGIVRGFTRGLLGKDTPESKCFMVCYPLQSYLSLCGVETDLIKGVVKSEKYIWGHYWLRLKDGRIIDPTSEQLNIEGGLKMPKIYMGEKPKEYKEN